MDVYSGCEIIQKLMLKIYFFLSLVYRSIHDKPSHSHPQSEARRKVRGDLGEGEVVSTGPGNLECRRLYHGFCLPSKERRCQKVGGE